MTLQEKYEKQKEINKELVDCNARLLDQVGAATKQAIELEKKNAELKERLAEVNLNGNIVLRELTKAKEIIKDLLEYSKEHWLYSDIKKQAEQFLEETK